MISYFITLPRFSTSAFLVNSLKRRLFRRHVSSSSEIFSSSCYCFCHLSLKLSVIAFLPSFLLILLLIPQIIILKIWTCLWALNFSPNLVKHSHYWVFQKKPPEVFLEISQNSQEKTCARVSFNKVTGHTCFPVNFAKFLRTPSLTEHLRWLLLAFQFLSLIFPCYWW